MNPYQVIKIVTDRLVLVGKIVMKINVILKLIIFLANLLITPAEMVRKAYYYIHIHYFMSLKVSSDNKLPEFNVNNDRINHQFTIVFLDEKYSLQFLR